MGEGESSRNDDGVVRLSHSARRRRLAALTFRTVSGRSRRRSGPENISFRNADLNLKTKVRVAPIQGGGREVRRRFDDLRIRGR